MDTFLWILACTFAVSLLGFAGIFSFWLREERMRGIVHLLMAFSVGGLLGGAFFHLLPEAMEALQPQDVLYFTLAGFIVFLLVESYFHWHHCEKCDVHPYSYLMIIGDAVHNFIDGLVISASFIAGIPLGIVTTAAIFGHEFPQQIGVFGVLVRGGFEKRKALLYSYLAQSTVIIGGVAGFMLSSSVAGVSSFLVTFAAGGFLYIAASDLIPEMHKEEGMEKLTCLFVFFLGLALMLLLGMAE